MCKSDILAVVLGTTMLVGFCGRAHSRTGIVYSMTPTTAQPRCIRQSMTQICAHDLVPPEIRGEKSAGLEQTTEPDFSGRLRGGTVLRFESGLIVVKPTDPPASLQPTSLTTDAIITSSVKSKIADQSQLRTGSFEIQTDNGVVTIRAKEESLEDAAAVINLALGISEVREIIYAMPVSV